MSGALLLRLRPGESVLHEGHRYLIKTVIDAALVYCLDQEGSDHKVLKISELKVAAVDEIKAKLEDVVAISASRLAVGDYRAELIRNLVAMPNRTRKDVEAVAKKANVDAVTVYRWIKRWDDAGSALALVPFRRGRVVETKLISKEAEEVIRKLIETQFLTAQKISAAKFVRNVKKACAALNVKAPHDNTIRFRLSTIPGIVRAQRRGSRRDVEKHTASAGTNPQGEFVLSDYQVDHTELPIIIVDDEHRKSIRRAWITVVIEVKSRVVAGFYLSLDPPSTQSVAMAVYNALTPKEDFLARLKVEAEWPVWGVPKTIHADNALEFRGNGLVFGCRQHDIDLQWRPVEQPRYGAHIERLIGTLGIELTSWSGATFSGPHHKADYDAEGHAIYTFSEAERAIAIWVAKIYHHSPHAGLGKRTPMGVFQEELIGSSEKPGIGLPDRPLDPNRMIIDFLRVEMRSITPSGISIDKVAYYDDELRPFVGEKNHWIKEHKGKYLCRIDDRAISPIYFFDPKRKDYIAVPYADKAHPIISTWQFKAAKEVAAAKGLSEVDEAAIFAAYDELEAQAKQSGDSTKARRQEQRKVEKDRSLKNVPAKVTFGSSAPAQKKSNDVAHLADDDALPPRTTGNARLIGV